MANVMFTNAGFDAAGVVLFVVSSDVHLGVIRKEDGVVYTFRPSVKYRKNKVLTSDDLRTISVKLELLNA